MRSDSVATIFYLAIAAVNISLRISHGLPYYLQDVGFPFLKLEIHTLQFTSLPPLTCYGLYQLINHVLKPKGTRGAYHLQLRVLRKWLVGKKMLLHQQTCSFNYHHHSEISYQQLASVTISLAAGCNARWCLRALRKFQVLWRRCYLL